MSPDAVNVIEAKNWAQAGTHWCIKPFSEQDTNRARILRPPIDIWGLINLKSSVEPMIKIIVAKIQNTKKSAYINDFKNEQ